MIVMHGAASASASLAPSIGTGVGPSGSGGQGQGSPEQGSGLGGWFRSTREKVCGQCAAGAGARKCGPCNDEKGGPVRARQQACMHFEQLHFGAGCVQSCLVGRF